MTTSLKIKLIPEKELWDETISLCYEPLLRILSSLWRFFNRPTSWTMWHEVITRAGIELCNTKKGKFIKWLKNVLRRKREILYYVPTTIMFFNRTNVVPNVSVKDYIDKIFAVFFTKSESFIQILRVYQYLFNYLKCLVTMSQSVKSDKLSVSVKLTTLRCVANVTPAKNDVIFRTEA